MASELRQTSHDEAFGQAKQAMSAELDAEMLSWDFSKMLEELKAAIQATKPEGDSNATRSFCHRFLHMPHQSHTTTYEQISACFKGRGQLSTETIVVILRSLKAWKDGTLPVVEVSKPPKPVDHRSCKLLAATGIATPEMIGEKTKPGIARKLIDHTISLFNSLVGLVVESGITPTDVFDGDRMQIRGALQKICDAFGINVIFPEPDPARNQPVTGEDLSNLGLPMPQQRRKK